MSRFWEIMTTFPVAVKACWLYLSLFSSSAFSESVAQSSTGVKCPKHQGSDPGYVNARVQQFASQVTYIADDDDYDYKITVCQKNSVDDIAIQQHGKKWEIGKPWVTIGKYSNAHVTGGTNWLMIKYFHGEKYHSHCNDIERLAVVIITCDHAEQRGTVKIIEEYRNSTTDDKGNPVPLECYYLFELNHDAACSDVTPSQQSTIIALIIVVVVQAILILLIFLCYCAKQMRQICGGGSRSGLQSRCPQPISMVDDDRDDILLTA